MKISYLCPYRSGGGSQAEIRCRCATGGLKHAPINIPGEPKKTPINIPITETKYICYNYINVIVSNISYLTCLKTQKGTLLQ